ncbi:MAG: acyl carrier protein [Deltaproteobacteria bacterium]|nr:acyl carrier protein [Deltaproteobacteria bacterium]
MTAYSRDDLRAAYLAELARIAPEADLSSLDPAADVREELDIDSMDVLHLVTALHARLGVDVPERDYVRVTTLDGAVAYLATRLGAT